MILLYNPLNVHECYAAAACVDLTAVEYTHNKFTTEQVRNFVDENVEGNEAGNDIIYVFPTLAHDEDPNIVTITDLSEFVSEHCNGDVYIKHIFNNDYDSIEYILSGIAHRNSTESLYLQFCSLFRSLGRIAEYDDLKLIGKIRLEIITKLITNRLTNTANDIVYYRSSEYVHHNIRLQPTKKACIFVDRFGTQQDECKYTLFYFNVDEEEIKKITSSDDITRHHDLLLPDTLVYRCTVSANKLASMLSTCDDISK